MKHGGKRKGAGRKKSLVPSVVISFRVPEDREEEMKGKVREFIKTELSK